jgi:hypothetical protein
MKSLFSQLILEHSRIEQKNVSILCQLRPGSRKKYICERFIFFYDECVYCAAAKYVHRSWDYINRSHTHECGNWG